MTLVRKRIAMWVFMLVLAIGINTLVAGIALACGSKGDCESCVDGFCSDYGGEKRTKYDGGECMGQCNEPPFDDEWFDCVCGV